MGIVTVHQKLAPPQREVADLALHLWQLWHMTQELELKNRYIEVSALYFTSIYSQNVCINVTKYGVNFAFLYFLGAQCFHIHISATSSNNGKC